jgi:ABC-type Fe3+/spermidine/putrescine transport system ATPase subunit
LHSRARAISANARRLAAFRGRVCRIKRHLARKYASGGFAFVENGAKRRSDRSAQRLLNRKYEFKKQIRPAIKADVCCQTPRRTFNNPPAMSYLTLERLQVRFGEQVAVHDLSLSAARGEFLTLLGPSGCGKTTTLRAIAGFAEPESGQVRVDGENITALPPHKRNIGMVFQSYALFPHLTVLENVAFGLRMRHVARAERDLRALAALDMVGMRTLAERYVTQLSGGQQQRVAIARALVIEPRILLLDEPLSNLDANLRLELRQEIRNLQKRLGITTILVTHDQQEALAVSDRVALMNGGRLVALGTPQELTDTPPDAFTATFIGGRTVIAGKARDGVFEAAGLTCIGAPEGATSIVLRTSRLTLNGGGGVLSVRGRVTGHTYLGDYFETDVETPSGRLRVTVPVRTKLPAIGEECVVSAAAGDVGFLI